MATPHLRGEYDVIVIGIGGIGSATLYWLTKNAPGQKILGIEQFHLGHVNGGSQDYSRIIRMLYHEDHFAKIAPYSFKAWKCVEEESGLQLVYKTGMLAWTTQQTGEAGLIKAYAEATKRYGTKCIEMNGKEIKNRWPQFTVPDDAVGVLDPEGGLVDAAMGNAAHVQLAEGRGARILQNTKVTKLTTNGPADVQVETDRGSFKCHKVIITCGGWLNQILATVGVYIPVKVSQEQVTYIATPHLKEFNKNNFPVCVHPSPEHHIYSLPIHGMAAFKIGVDAGGHGVTADGRTFIPDPRREKIVTDYVNTFLPKAAFKIGVDAGGHGVTADGRTFIPDPRREKTVTDFVNKFVPKASGRIMETKTCLYTMTYDRNFVIDSLVSRGHPDILVCCGAGHAYKFASLFGQILSDLAINNRSDHDLSAFRLNRPAIIDPNFKPIFVHSLASINKAKL